MSDPNCAKPPKGRFPAIGVRHFFFRSLLFTKKHKIKVATHMRVMPTSMWRISNVGCGQGSISKGGLADRLYREIGENKRASGVHYNSQYQGNINVVDTLLANRIDVLVASYFMVSNNRGKIASIAGVKVKLFLSVQHDTAAFANAVLMYARYGAKKMDRLFQISDATRVDLIELYNNVRVWYANLSSRLFEQMKQHIPTGGAGGQHVPFGLGSPERFRKK